MTHTEHATSGRPHAGAAQDRVSLLWPPGWTAPPGTGLDAEAIDDLDLHPLVDALSGREARHERFVRRVLAELCPDADVIAFRAEVVDDLLRDPALRADLQHALRGLDVLAQQAAYRSGEWAVYRITQRLTELETFVDVAQQLNVALQRARPRSQAVQALRAHLGALTDAPEFVSLRAELPVLRERVSGMRSITVGINLSDDLAPEAAAILSINTEKIAGQSVLLERLLGKESGRRGITPLRSGDMGQNNALLRDLRRLLERAITPVEEVLARYATVQTRVLADLGPELSFLLRGAALTERLRGAGLPVCRPEIAPIDERVGAVEDGYNVSLALRMLGQPDAAAGAMIVNPLTFDGERGRVWVLTGPNRGGKTTYTRAAGLIHILFQAGLYVPARCARLSPVDAIYTHFPSHESTALGRGRLDDEAVRLAAIFARATPHSLILLNEVLTGTSTIEALGLAHDALRGLHLLGARAIYVTHLHELALHVDEINDTTAGDGTVGSLVAEVADDAAGAEALHRRTFRIRPGRPRGVSYASEIAEQHGISFPQLERLLHARGILPEAASAAGARRPVSGD